MKWLKVQHNQGKYLDLTEEMITSLTEDELLSLVYSEYASKEILPHANEELENMLKDENYYLKHPITYNRESTDGYKNLYSLSEEKANNLVETIKKYTEEKKEALALVALGGVGGLALLKKGKILLEDETAKERFNRRKILQGIKEESYIENKDLWQHYKDGNYASMLSEEDTLKNVTEEALCKGVTQKQMKDIITQQNKMCENQAKLISHLYNDYKQEVANKNTNSSKTSFGKEWKINPQELKLKSDNSIKERLEKSEKIAEDLFGKK